MRKQRRSLLGPRDLARYISAIQVLSEFGKYKSFQAHAAAAIVDGSLTSRPLGFVDRWRVRSGRFGFHAKVHDDLRSAAYQKTSISASAGARE
jgi:hypothetical protein